MMEEELEAPESGLGTPLSERHEMRGLEEPIAAEGPEDIEIPRREDHAAHRNALETGPTGIGVRHRDQRTGRSELRKGGGLSQEFFLGRIPENRQISRGPALPMFVLILFHE